MSNQRSVIASPRLSSSLVPGAILRRLVWNVLPVGLVLLAVQLVFLGEDGLLKRHQVKQRLYTTQAKVEQAEAENATLRTRLRMLKTDPVFVEREVAERLFAAPEGSTIYRFAGPAVQH